MNEGMNLIGKLHLFFFKNHLSLQLTAYRNGYGEFVKKCPITSVNNVITIAINENS